MRGYISGPKSCQAPPVPKSCNSTDEPFCFLQTTPLADTHTVPASWVTPSSTEVVALLSVALPHLRSARSGASLFDAAPTSPTTRAPPVPKSCNSTDEPICLVGGNSDREGNLLVEIVRSVMISGPWKMLQWLANNSDFLGQFERPMSLLLGRCTPSTTPWTGLGALAMKLI